MKDLDRAILRVIEGKGFSKADIDKAIKIALKSSGDMTKASKAIEKIAKGLSDEPAVVDALKLANESVEVAEAKVTVNVDWMGDVRDPDTSKVLKKYKIKAKEKGDTADLTGDSKDVAKYLQAVHHAGEYKTVQDLLDDGLYSELEESVVSEALSTKDIDNMYTKVTNVADALAALGKKDKSAKREITAIVKQLDAAADSLSQLGMSAMESVEVTEAIDAAHPTSRYRGREQLKLSKFLRKKTGTEKVYFDGANLVVGSKTALPGALDPAKKFTVQDLINAVEKFNESTEVVTEASGGKEEYKKFFNSALEKFGVKSPAELDDDKKKEFFNYIDKNWEGKSEED